MPIGEIIVAILFFGLAFWALQYFGPKMPEGVRIGFYVVLIVLFVFWIVNTATAIFGLGPVIKLH